MQYKNRSLRFRKGGFKGIQAHFKHVNPTILFCERERVPLQSKLTKILSLFIVGYT